MKKHTNTHLTKTVFSYLLLVLWAAVIFSFSAQDAVSSTEQSNFILSLIAKITHIQIEENAFWMTAETIVRKLAHFTIYLVLGFLAANAFRFNINRRLVLISVMFCLLYAATDELHQYFVPGRSCRVLDIIIDTSGGALGALIYSKILRRWYC